MTPEVGRWLGPAGASAAVLAVFVVPGVVATGKDGFGPGLDRAPDRVIPTEVVTPPLPPDRADQALEGQPDVDVTGYRAAGRTLSIFYTVDQSADCSTRIEPPQVVETERMVLVRLVRRSSRAPDAACSEIRLATSVDIPLRAPLSDRLVRDAVRDGALVPAQRPIRPRRFVVPTPPASRAGR
jgi:hypothetical protein